MTKIDVHHHIYPPRMISVLEDNGGDPSGWPVPTWTQELDDSFRESLEIGTTIYSVTAPGACILSNGADAAALARELNEYCAALRDRNPNKYGFFLSLGSLLDTTSCIEEIRHAFDTLHADGVTLFTRYGEDNHYLGHEDFIPIWQELNARNAVVFIHPTHAVDTTLVNAQSPQPMYDYPHETTRAAMDLIMSNRIRQFPNCKIILSHAGGTLPYLIHRLTMIVDTPFAIHKTRDEIIEDARQFYFDLALSGSDLVLDMLCKFAKPGHVLFGSDFPNAPTPSIKYFTKVIEDHDFDRNMRDDIYHEGAVALFPRLRGVSQ